MSDPLEKKKSINRSGDIVVVDCYPTRAGVKFSDVFKKENWKWDVTNEKVNQFRALNCALRARLGVVLLCLAWSMAMCPQGNAQSVYPFQGRLDLVEKKFECLISRNQESVTINIHKQDGQSFLAKLDIHQVQTPLFEITTQIQSVMEMIPSNQASVGLKGNFWSMYSLMNGKSIPEISGSFELRDGVMTLDRVAAENMIAKIVVGLTAPHPLDAVFNFDGIDLEYFVDWLVGEKSKYSARGDVAGQIVLSGSVHKPVLRASVFSENGNIEHIGYDRAELRIQGVYPNLEVANSMVTRTGGFSFNLDGTIDLSDKKTILSQIKSIKKNPLIKENSLHSEWVLKQVEESGQEGALETKYFLKKDKGLGYSGQEDHGLLGVEKQIGF